MHEKAFRKTAINAAVAFAALLTASTGGGLEDASLAFMVSEISITIAAFATVAAITWPGWIAYHDGRIVEDPVQRADLVRAVRLWWRRRRG